MIKHKRGKNPSWPEANLFLFLKLSVFRIVLVPGSTEVDFCLTVPLFLY